MPGTANRFANANSQSTRFRERKRTVKTLNVWSTQFHASLVLSFLDPIRKQQQHAEACKGENDEYRAREYRW
jgi:hypothetical protein